MFLSNRLPYKKFGVIDTAVIESSVRIFMLFSCSEIKIHFFPHSVFFFENQAIAIGTTKYWIKTCVVSNLDSVKTLAK